MEADLNLQFPDIHTEIDVLTQTIVVSGDEKKVRPKTFQLLQVLIEADGELVSKETLLKTVWDDVVVDEQVIFQSIKELRKLFPGQTVIKTVPRKGYAWLPKAQIPIDQTPTKHTWSSNKLRIFGLSIIALVLLLAFISSNQFNAPAKVSGSIVVLPVQSDIPVNDLSWVRFGVMDQVIGRLKSTQQAGVLQTDYVLDVLNRAGVSMEDASVESIPSIFNVSGAELILAMRLAGNPNDYQIIYSLYQRDNVEKGVVLDVSVQAAADQVAELVGKRLSPDYTIPTETYTSSFSDRLIAEALEAKYSDSKNTAVKILEAAALASPDDLVAPRLLVQMLVESGAPLEQVQKIALPALQLAQQRERAVEQIRLGFWLAMSESMHSDPAQGIQRLEEVRTLASSINDWLYLAYIEEIFGQYNQQLQSFSAAQNHYDQAMEYHRILRCPLGQSNTLMHLSRLAYAEQNPKLALKKAQQALSLIESRGLNNKLPQAKQWLGKLRDKAHSDN